MEQEKGYENKEGYERSYKSNWKKWVAIYVVIAIVLYGGIYLYIKHRNSSTTSSSGTTTNSNSIY